MENRTLLHCVGHSGDKGIFEIPKEYLPPNGVLSNEGYIFFRSHLKVDLSFGKNKEGYEMCRGVELWKAEMMALGRNEGIQQGIQQGLLQGVQNDRKEIILYMLGNNFSPEQIHQMTNIPLVQVLDVASGSGFRIVK